MITKKRLSIIELLVWSRRDLLKFLIVAALPVGVYVFLDFKFLHLPMTPIALLGTAVAFVVGFKNNACYDRMWEARKIWGGIINASRAWGIMVRDFINNKHVKNEALSNEEIDAVKLKIINRHLAWLTAHRYTLRSPKPWEDSMANKSNIEFMEKNGHVIPEKEVPLQDALKLYIDNDELNYVMSKSNKATTLISLQSEHLKELVNKGHIWEFSYLEMEKLLVEFYALQGKNERIKNFPYPRQFATLNFTFVWIFILLLPFGLMGIFDDLGVTLMGTNRYTGNAFAQLIFGNFIWLSIPFCMIISWVFYAIERVGETSENPFEGLPSDIPITSMSRTIEIDLLDILDASIVPKPIAAVNDIEM